jgi:hypothetical protein
VNCRLLLSFVRIAFLFLTAATSEAQGAMTAAVADAGAVASAAEELQEEPAMPVSVLHSYWEEAQDGERRIVSSRELPLEVPANSQLMHTVFARLHFGAWGKEGRAEPDCKVGHGIDLQPFLRSPDGRHQLTLRIPDFYRIETVLKPSAWEAVVFTHRALLCFEDGDHKPITQLSVELAEPKWALAWATLAVLLVWLGLGLLARRHLKGVHWWNPLGLAMDRTHRYSLSLAQSLLWTYVVAFGLVYAWKITERHLDISPDVLILLGIGGSTALLTHAQKLARWRDIPERYRRMVQAQGTPKLSDLVTEDGVPSVPKVQMLIFTILISFTVVKQIWETYRFPDLSDGLVALMGISSALYVGNTVQKADSLETVSEKMQAFEDKMASTGATDQDDVPETAREKADLVKAIRNYLL